MRLKELLQKEIEKNILKTKSTFGRRTEGFLSMLDAADNPEEEPVDESGTEDTGSTEERKKRVIPFPGSGGPGKHGRNASGGKRRKGQGLARSLDSLPKQLVYDIDVEALDREYGRGGWRIAHWHSHKELMKLDSPYYTKVTYTPAISVGLEHGMLTVPYGNPLIDRSPVSPSVIADILYRKFFLGLPFYRQARDCMMQGAALSKQTMINWANTLVPRFLSGLHEYMVGLLVGYRYIQSDETFIQVNRDGHGPGHKSYFWIHTTSELLGCPPLIVFCYEPTRGTDHLRGLF